MAGDCRRSSTAGELGSDRAAAGARTPLALAVAAARLSVRIRIQAQHTRRAGPYERCYALPSMTGHNVDSSSLLEAVRKLVPMIRSYADEIERDRELPRPLF